MGNNKKFILIILISVLLLNVYLNFDSYQGFKQLVPNEVDNYVFRLISWIDLTNLLGFIFDAFLIGLFWKKIK